MKPVELVSILLVACLRKIFLAASKERYIIKLLSPWRTFSPQASQGQGQGIVAPKAFEIILLQFPPRTFRGLFSLTLWELPE